MKRTVFSVAQVVGHQVLDTGCELAGHLVQDRGFGVIINDARNDQVLYSAMRVNTSRPGSETQTLLLLEDMRTALAMSNLNVPPLGTHLAMMWPIPGRNTAVWMVRTNTLVALCVGDPACAGDACGLTAQQIAFVLCSMVNKWMLYNKEDVRQYPALKTLDGVARKALRKMSHLEQFEEIENVLAPEAGTFYFSEYKKTHRYSGSFCQLSGCRGSNPVYMTPSHVYYRYTTARKELRSLRESPDALRARNELDTSDAGLLEVRVLA